MRFFVQWKRDTTLRSAGSLLLSEEAHMREGWFHPAPIQLGNMASVLPCPWLEHYAYALIWSLCLHIMICIKKLPKR